MKILTVVGARPQFIKSAPVSRELRAHPEISEVLVHTGQHYDKMMSSIFFDELEIRPPDYNLGIGSGSHGVQTGRMLEDIEHVLLKEHPDWVLVYGDTNSTLSGALAAAKLHISVAHVEAGLRSFNRHMPEEINRVVTDHIADLLLAPTDMAVRHLKAEGIPDERVHVVGDVMFDAASYYGLRAEQESRIIEKLGLTSKEYILATVHRAENTNNPDRLEVIVDALGQITAEATVVWPVHPRTGTALSQMAWRTGDRAALKLVQPVGYLDMVMLERHARLIATDSGGVQKEAFFHRVPCVTLRDETEWTELIDLGWNRLAPPSSSGVVINAIRGALESPPGREGAPYGDGSSACLVVEALINRSSDSQRGAA